MTTERGHTQLEPQKQSFVSMDDSQSESESGESLAKRIRDRGTIFKKQLELMEGLRKYGSIDDKVIRCLRIAYQLHANSNEFIELHKKIEGIRAPEEIEASFYTILGDLRKVEEGEKINNITIEEIAEIVEDLKLVGEELARSFSEYKERLKSPLKSYENMPEEYFCGSETKKQCSVVVEKIEGSSSYDAGQQNKPKPFN